MKSTNVALFALAAAMMLAPTVAAHASKTTENGEYRITWGLLDEPGFAGEKNRLDLIVRDNATLAGIGGLSGEDLTVTLVYGEEEYDLGDVTAYHGAKGGAFAGPGNYTSQNFVYLTRPGIYTLHVEGEIQGVPVDLDIPATHEYEPLSEISFPDEASQGDLEARVAALEAEVQALKAQQQTQSSTPATVTEQTPQNGVPTASVLLAALGVGAAALLLRRRA